MSKIAVLIPCYNESKTIETVVKDYRKVLPKADIYVYDNNSSDHTDEIAREAGAIVRYEYRQGKGNVIRSMFRDIEADVYLMIDGDDTYPAEHAGAMISMVLDKGADMVIGDRLSSTYFTENKRLFHNSGNVIVRKFINMLWQKKKNEDIKDVMTGYRAFSPLFVKSFPVISEGFEIETEMTIHALDKNFMLRSLPVTYRDRPVGSESKLNTYIDGAKVLLTIFKLYRDYKPLKFFSWLATVLLFVSFLMFLPVFIEYLQEGIVPRLPTLITAGFIMMIAIQSMVCGIILETETKKSRQAFELNLNIIKLLLDAKI